MTKSAIEWTDETWNPVRGCARVSPGCSNCYAERVAMRFRGQGQPYEGLVRMTSQGPKWEGNVQLVHEKLEEPMRWRRPRRVFVNSMSDLFHEDVPFSYIDKVFAIMCRAREHTFQVLTKRADRMLEYMSDPHRHGYVLAASHENEIRIAAMEWCRWPAPNIWLGVSAEDQKRADERIPKLLLVPAAVRFVSLEPLLGPMRLNALSHGDETELDALRGLLIHTAQHVAAAPSSIGARIDWVICGGESGPGARPMHPDWPRSLRDQCAAAGVPFFFKQWGEWKPISEMADGECTPLYRSNRRAREGQDQAVLDDLYGRTCTVDELCLRIDGNHVPMESPNAFLAGTRPMQAFRIGKKAAGRLLDGRTHDEFPRGAA